MQGYAELQISSNFSFLRGASQPDELVHAAASLGLGAVSLTDRNSLAGVVRGHMAAKQAGIAYVVGCRLDLIEGISLLCWPTDRAAYGRLCTLLSRGKRRAEKGECEISLADVAEFREGQVFALIPPEGPEQNLLNHIKLSSQYIDNIEYLSINFLYRGDDVRRLNLLLEVAQNHGLRPLASNDVHYHIPARRELQDVLTCIRELVPIDRAGGLLAANAERHIKPPAEMARMFAEAPQALANGLEIAQRCTFSLDELAYEYPDDPICGEGDPQEILEELVWKYCQTRYPEGLTEKVRNTLQAELQLIGDLEYAPYFLTVFDIVNWARAQQILCQGRGSAANSAICFVLGITSVDPTKVDLLFERFVSAERGEPPDIDVDFEHERREEVIQYIYEKYGRHRAGIAATIISYRSRSAIRDVGKALGLSEDVTGALANMGWGSHSSVFPREEVRNLGFDPDDPRLALALKYAEDILGFPRHLSQHVGGFVITKGPLEELVPIGNAAMEDRTFVEWDKDDLDALGILKIDVLSLGMLTAIRKGLDMIADHYGRRMDMAQIPPEDSAVYDMLCEADSLGVFQVESRAQMSMLPRLKPRCFYDLVIEVAIVRPGPIQGDMVHPYLRRRDGLEQVHFPSPAPEHGPPNELHQVLGKTLGVPLFQEQAMRIAIVAAGFTPSESDELRRAMATFRRHGTIGVLKDKFINGMTRRGYELDFAERCFHQIEGFADYGFPESHSASFSLLVYVSAWIKKHYPDVFLAALLNAQPMGFYAPAQLVRDAQEHGVEVRPPCLNRSDWDCTLEPVRGGGWAVRLGLRQIKGFSEAAAALLMSARGEGFTSIEQAQKATGLEPPVFERLAEADAYRCLGLDRRQGLWAVRALGKDRLPLFDGIETLEPPVALPAMKLGEHVIHDYASLRLSLKAHPMQLMRPYLADLQPIRAEQLRQIKNDAHVCVAGLVLVRQRPGTSKGVIFLTIEDETGPANIIVWKKTYQRFRKAVLGARLVGIRGKVQREGKVIHVISEQIIDLSDRLGVLSEEDGHFERALSRADEFKRPVYDRRPLPPRSHPRSVGGRPLLPQNKPNWPKSRDFH